MRRSWELVLRSWWYSYRADVEAEMDQAHVELGSRNAHATELGALATELVIQL